MPPPPEQVVGAEGGLLSAPILFCAAHGFVVGGGLCSAPVVALLPFQICPQENAVPVEFQVLALTH